MAEGNYIDSLYAPDLASNQEVRSGVLIHGMGPIHQYGQCMTCEAE